MLQFVYKEKMYVIGRIDQVTAHLRELSSRFKTVREYLESLTKDL